MAEKGKVVLICFTALVLADIVCADQCSTGCGARCTYTRCLLASRTVDVGCWWDGKACFNCRTGDRDVKKCRDYTSLSPCRLNPCRVEGDCKWEDGSCMGLAEDVPSCMTAGCKASYKCMADGECVHSSVSVQKYCNTGYKLHGFSYDPAKPKACEELGAACREMDAKCRFAGNESSGSQRMAECMSLRNMCMQCRGDCEARRNVGNIEGIIYGIAGGIAALVLVYNAVSLITAQDPLARKNAKEGMVFVLLSLLIIVAGIKFVEYLWTSFT